MESDALPVDATQAVPVVTPKVTWTPTAPPEPTAPTSVPAAPVPAPVAPAAAPVPWPAAHAIGKAPTVIESKVVASTGVALAASIGVAILNGVAANSQLLGGLPPAVQALVLALVPPLLTFVAGYQVPSNRA